VNIFITLTTKLYLIIYLQPKINIPLSTFRPQGHNFNINMLISCNYTFQSVHWHCWLGNRKGIHFPAHKKTCHLSLSVMCACLCI